jgi:hypothetical protein
MHTVTALLKGLLLLWFLINLGAWLGFQTKTTDRGFVLLWLMACLHHAYLGVEAGYGITLEAAIGSFIFIVPVAVLVCLRCTSARRAREHSR